MKSTSSESASASSSVPCGSAPQPALWPLWSSWLDSWFSLWYKAGPAVRVTLLLSPALVCAALLGMVFSVLHFWPSSYWMEVKSIHVASGAHSTRLPMIVDRTIKRNFHGHWIVSLRRWEGDGYTIECTASGDSNYRVGARFPAHLTLGWWTEGQCHPLRPGRYVASTTWVIQSLGLIPDKVVEVDSLPFEVIE